MRLRRITEHVKAQNWTAVWLDLIIVVVGVFIGIQVANWNDARTDRVQENLLLKLLRDDIKQDIIDLKGAQALFTDVHDYGRIANTSLTQKLPCVEDCWPQLVAFFHASQWNDIRVNKATFEEINRNGFLNFASFKNKLISYYSLVHQISSVLAEKPQYRKLVRSIIPGTVQEYLWNECFQARSTTQYLSDGCPAPVNVAETRRIVESLRANNNIRTSLNFWMSTISLVEATLPESIVEAKSVLVSIDDDLERW